MKMFLLKYIPEDLHREVKAAAALMGITINDFILRAIVEYLRLTKKGGVK